MSRKNKLKVLGVMSGTSLDGVDYVLIEISHKGKIKFIKHFEFEIPQSTKKNLHKIASGVSSGWELAEGHYELGRLFAAQYKQIPKKYREEIDLIGIHGQTVYHAPPRATFQIGEMSFLAEASGLEVISNFRPNDLCVGGQGAPLASLFHQVAFSKEAASVAVQNLGGIGNVTHIVDGVVQKCFDTGPANILMNLLVFKLSQGQLDYDKDGNWARKGKVNQALLHKMLKHSFFSKKPPKSCGREEFGEGFLKKHEKELLSLNPYDQMATICELTAMSICQSYKKFLKPRPEKIILCGGGSSNQFLLNRLRALMPEIEIGTSEMCGWPSQSIEGAAFALLAAFRYWKKPANIPSTTGASRAVLLGQISKV